MQSPGKPARRPPEGEPSERRSADSGSGRSLTCPHCKGAIRARHLEAGRQLRCSSCRGHLGGPETGPVQWLYPERPRSLGPAAARTDSAHDSAATYDTLDASGERALEGERRRIGRYALHDELGRGGMGVVYAAWDEDLRREVALKVLLTGSFASTESRKRFIGEARAAAGLHHVHIVRVFDMGEMEGQPWFAMERVFGPSLEEILSVSGGLPIEEAARIGHAIASAVSHAHTHTSGVAHRDLKPGNVLLDGDGHPRITDFGLARPLEDAHHLTATQQVLGTPSYMPPEVARADRSIDWIRADVYGLGGVLYAALTGRPPIVGASLAQRLEAAASGRHHSARRFRPEVPIALDAIVAKALHPDPDHRYRNAGALAEDLRRFRAGEPVVARPETVLERAGRWSRRHARTLLVGGLVTLAIGIVGAWAPVRTTLARNQREAAAARAWEGVEAGLDAPEGAARLDEFVASEQYRGTAAAARAWLRRGDDLAKLPHPHGELGVSSQEYVEAWARALTESQDAEVRGAALVRMARSALSRAAYEDLAVLLRAIQDLPVGAVSPADQVPLELATALAEGDRDRAAAAWDRAGELGLPEATTYEDPRWIPDVFLHGTPIPDAGEEDPLTDLHDPQGPAFLHLDGPSPARIDLLPSIRSTPAGPMDRSHVTNRRWGDTDGDGVEEAYEARDRVLYRVAPDERSDVPILPEVTRTSSELVQDLADLDGDGRDELVVGLGEWRAYDVRVYDATPGGYRLRARVRANDTLALGSIPDPWGKGRLLVATESDHYSNGNRHGIDTPDGPASALCVWRLVGDALEEVFRLDLDSRGIGPGKDFDRGVITVDIDGDGREEIVQPMDGRALVLRPGVEPGSFRLAVFSGTIPFDARQLDDDPAIELLARGPKVEGARALWILGRGDTTPPRPAPPAPPDPLAVPDGALEGPIASVWRDATVLLAANLDSSAASLLLRAADLAKDPEPAAAAADLWQGLGRLASAAEAMELAADATQPGAAAESRWADAVNLWLEAADPDAALAAADRWRAAGVGPDADMTARLAVWETARTHMIRLTPGAVPDAAWQVTEPLAFELGPNRTRLVGPYQVIARMPVTTLGGAIALLVDGTIDAAEGVAFVTLGEGLGFGVSRNGMDKSAALIGRCLPRDLYHAPRAVLPPLGTATRAPVRVRFRLTWTPSEGTWRCAVAYPEDGEAVRSTYTEPVPSDLALALQGGGAGKAEGFTLERLEAWGVEPKPRVPTALDRANLALLRQDPAEALALLPEDAWVERAVAFGQLRRTSEAIGAFRHAFERDPAHLDARLPFLLRPHRETYAPLIRPAVGDRWPALLDGVFHWATRHVHDPSGVDEALRVELEGAPWPLDPEDPGWCILADRVGALVRGPDPSRGVAAGREWLAAFEALRVPRDADPWALASKVHRELAFEAARRGDTESATREAQTSVDVSPTPASAVDRVWVSPIWREAGLPLPVAHPHD